MNRLFARGTGTRTHAPALSAQRGAGSCLYEKHSILLFFLGNLRLLVTRMASCHAGRMNCTQSGAGGCLHEKHSFLLFFLGNLRLLVMRFASCEAVIRGAGIGGSSRSVGRILAPATRLLPGLLHEKHSILLFLSLIHI